MQLLINWTVVRKSLMSIHEIWHCLFSVFLILAISGCGESDEQVAERSRSLDIEFESMVEGVFRRESMDSWLEEVESLGIAYIGKTKVTYPDKSGAYLVYGLQNVSTGNRGNGYIFLFCTIDVGYPGSTCPSSSLTFLSAERYSVDAIKELVRKSNSEAFRSLEHFSGFGPNQRSTIFDINYQPNFE